MAKFVMQYVFLPLNLRGVQPQDATISAFIFHGPVHEVKIGYLIWGIAHGVLMAFMPKAAPDANRVRRLGGRALTLSSVVILSYVANYTFKG